MHGGSIWAFNNNDISVAKMKDQHLHLVFQSNNIGIIKFLFNLLNIIFIIIKKDFLPR